ncbi:MAG: hypothetical protein KIT09_33190 [Bryobacteraceae bacterium]|nr:hypothetical protein [Bryobacteraceae bacterium]
MPLPARTLLILLAASLSAAASEGAAPRGPTFFYHYAGDEPGAWPDILQSVGLVSGSGGVSGVFVVRVAPADLEPQWRERVEQGAFLILEGDSDLAGAFGFRPTAKRVAVRNVLDHRDPKLAIIWEKALELAVFDVPEQARIFARERWTGAPLIAGFQQGAGAVLWVAASPGEHGHERFPYLLHALGDLGFQAPFRFTRLWAFLDPPYRSRVDLDYFARRWRRSGIGALQVSAWHYVEPDETRDAWLKQLIEACHREAILVYAWIEFPHVSEAFWNNHPEWREKTAILQDAHLDWRKLMNLVNRDCYAATAAGLHSLIDRFDWDGVNLAELYFESLEGYENPARFTPLNNDVRREFQSSHGFDPLEIFQPESPLHYSKNTQAIRTFLDYRAGLARRIQEEWIAEVEIARKRKRHLDLVLTHVDDRFDTGMRDSIGADAAALLPMLDRHPFTFLIEDPATIWHLGPKRYPEIAAKYEPLTPHAEKLAIDINIVERYQDVYPTKQQTGTELYQQVHLASKAFAKVALYAEHSILRDDEPFLPSAAAAVERVAQVDSKLVVESRFGAGVPWSGPALVNGNLWPFADDRTLWLPAGAHAVQPADRAPPLRLLDFGGDLSSALATADGLEFAYRSDSRAIAVLDRAPAKLEIDGDPAEPRLLNGDGRYALMLPRGQHLVTIQVDAAPKTSATIPVASVRQ